MAVNNVTEEKATESHGTLEEAMQFHLRRLTEMCGDKFLLAIAIPQADGIDLQVTTWQFPYAYYTAAVEKLSDELEFIKDQSPAPARPEPLKPAEIAGMVQTVSEHAVIREPVGGIEHVPDRLDDSYLEEDAS